MGIIQITTLNIRCFGFGGDYFGKNRIEHRMAHLQDFIKSNFSKTDVFVFQEIMNPQIIDQILPTGFKTYTYKHTYDRHMFVVLACSSKFEFKNFRTISNTAIDGEKSRPAVYGQLNCDDESILNIIGVHLKSKHDHTENRIKQAQAISNFIKNLPEQTPVVITGDFNCHLKARTSQPKDDLYLIQDIFGEKIKVIDHQKPTCLSAAEELSLDHFFIRGFDSATVEVYPLPDYSTYQPFKKYYNEISDHLPVTAYLKNKL